MKVIEEYIKMVFARYETTSFAHAFQRTIIAQAKNFYDNYRKQGLSVEEARSQVFLFLQDLDARIQQMEIRKKGDSFTIQRVFSPIPSVTQKEFDQSFRYYGIKDIRLVLKNANIDIEGGVGNETEIITSGHQPIVHLAAREDTLVATENTLQKRDVLKKPVHIVVRIPHFYQVNLFVQCDFGQLKFHEVSLKSFTWKANGANCIGSLESVGEWSSKTIGGSITCSATGNIKSLHHSSRYGNIALNCYGAIKKSRLETQSGNIVLGTVGDFKSCETITESGLTHLIFNGVNEIRLKVKNTDPYLENLHPQGKGPKVTCYNERGHILIE